MKVTKIRKCAEWLAQWVEAGGDKKDLPALEKLWMDNHDNFGNYVPKKTEELQSEAVGVGEGVDKLFDLLAQYGGAIFSTASLDTEQIAQAKASGRMFVNENGLGYVWEYAMKFPETPEEVELFERFYPLDIEVPDLDFDRIFKEANSVKPPPTPEWTDEKAIDFNEYCNRYYEYFVSEENLTPMWRDRLYSDKAYTTSELLQIFKSKV